jgi:phosphoribosyl 1,2-cyclic phosphodiesterase
MLTSPLPLLLSLCLSLSLSLSLSLPPSLHRRHCSADEVMRFVSNIDWINYSHFKPFSISSVSITPFPVMHGEDLESSGYLIGNEAKLCYISDISRMIPASLQLIQSQGPIDLLIVDALSAVFNHPTHYSIDQAIDLCRQIRPKRCLFVGMGSDIEHGEMNERLKKYLLEEGLDIQLAHDGLLVDIDL